MKRADARRPMTDVTPRRTLLGRAAAAVAAAVAGCSGDPGARFADRGRG